MFLFLDDGTGRLLIAPQGAELDLHRDLRKEYNASFFLATDDAPPRFKVFLFVMPLTPIAPFASKSAPSNLRTHYLSSAL
jgi:hypothetical protein